MKSALLQLNGKFHSGFPANKSIKLCLRLKAFRTSSLKKKKMLGGTGCIFKRKKKKKEEEKRNPVGVGRVFAVRTGWSAPEWSN